VVLPILLRKMNLHRWPRPRWVSEARWTNQHDLDRIIPIERAIELRRKAVKILSSAFEDECFEDLMRLVFPGEADRNLYYVAIWHIRDGLSHREIANRLGSRHTGNVSHYAKKALARIKEYLDLHKPFKRFLRPEEPELDPDEELEMEIREVIRG
jgi:hypothetical protein